MPHENDINFISSFAPIRVDEKEKETPIPNVEQYPDTDQEDTKMNTPREPAPKTAKKGKKAKPASSLRAKEKDEDRQIRLTYNVNEEERELIMRCKYRLRRSVSDMSREFVINCLQHGYTCAACNQTFALIGLDGPAEKPAMCPCCGNNKLFRSTPR